jgi:hypothetical protein
VALGVDLGKIQSLHLVGGRDRVAIVSGKELREHGASLLFSFTQSTTGKARLHVKPGIVISDSIDKIQNVLLYQERPAPIWNAQKLELELDGHSVEGVPYAAGELRGGTRLYLDGRLLGLIKRNRLPPLEPKETAYPLLKVILGLGLPLSTAKTVDLIDDDRQVARIPFGELAGATFSVVEKSGGQIAIEPRGLTATALLFYEKAAPPVLDER